MLHWLFLIDRKWLFLFDSTWLIQPDANTHTLPPFYPYEERTLFLVAPCRFSCYQYYCYFSKVLFQNKFHIYFIIEPHNSATFFPSRASAKSGNYTMSVPTIGKISHYLSCTLKLFPSASDTLVRKSKLGL